MKHITSIIVCLALSLPTLMWGQNGYGGEFDPSNPPDPTTSEGSVTRYSLTVKVDPKDAGYVNTFGGAFTAGTSVYLSQSESNPNYMFEGWLNESGEVLSTSYYIYYTMPESDVTLTAKFARRTFDPSSPADPETPEEVTPTRTQTLRLKAEPEQGGYFNYSTGLNSYIVGSENDIYAYTNTNYDFVGWKVNGSSEIASNDRHYVFTMPETPMELTGVFKFNPQSPANPNANYWNEATGEVIIDDFVTGNLRSTIDNKIGGSGYRSQVSQLTVSGMMNSNDFGLTSYYSNCSYIDLSRTGGYTSLPYYAFEYGSMLNEIILPSSLEQIGYCAFYQCTSLSSVTCYALTPPTLDTYAFEGISEDAVLYVPAVAVAAYQEAEGWKDYFTVIQPIRSDVHAVEVNLPADCVDGRYRNMTIELVNTVTGQKHTYIVNDRIKYVFNGLIKNSTYNCYLRNQQGVLLGQISDIRLNNDDLAVTFEDLVVLYTPTVVVLNPDGRDITAEVQSIQWKDTEGNNLSRSAEILGQPEGTELSCVVTLTQDQGMMYKQPQALAYTVDPVQLTITVQLDELTPVTLTGQVVALDSSPLMGVSVSLSQKLNGLYTRSIIVKTDKNGAYTVEAYDEPTSITVSYPDYVSKTFDYADFGENTDLGIYKLKPITGALVNLSFTFTESVGADETAETVDFYSGYENVAYSIYNVTRQEAITDYNLQYPQIVLLQETDEGDELEITASSKTGAFRNVTVRTSIDATNNADACFDIVDLGGINARFNSTDNASVVALLYDGNGTFVNKYTYGASTLSINGLTDGTYTVVTMADSEFFNSILYLSQMASLGLAEGKDYLKNTVEVTSGHIASVANNVVPTLDESKFYYTGSNTGFSANKASIVSGNYLTLKAVIDFKSAYAANVSEISLAVDLPEDCSFVENSVMCGSTLSSYTLDDTRLVIPVQGNASQQIRFCVVPTAGGQYAPSATANFTISGKKVSQPIGSAKFTVTDLSLTVPSTSAKTTVPVSGVAVGKSAIEVYDNGVLIGQTVALANGCWNANCELANAYNLSSHSIYAKVTTPSGLEIMSETQKCVYDKDAIEPKTVTMSFYNGWLRQQVQVTFDFRTNKTSSSSYMFYTGTDLTFVADFTNNDTTAVSNVNIYVYTDRGEVRKLNAHYDARKDRWVAVSRFESNNLPVNLSIDFKANTQVVADLGLMDEATSLVNAMIEELGLSVQEVQEALEYIRALDPESPDYNAQLLLLMDRMLGNTISYDDIKTIDIELTPAAISAELTQIAAHNSEITDIMTMLSQFGQLTTTGEFRCGNLVLTSLPVTQVTLDLTRFERYETVDGMPLYVAWAPGTFEMAVLAKGLYLKVEDLGAGDFVLPDSNYGDIRDLKAWAVRLAKLAQDLYAKLKPLENWGDDFNAKSATAEYEMAYLKTLLTPANLRLLMMAGINMQDLQRQLVIVSERARYYRCLSKFATFLKRSVPMTDAVQLFMQLAADINTCIDLYLSIPYPCPNDEEAALELRRRIVTLGCQIGLYGAWQAYLIGSQLVTLPVTFGTGYGVMVDMGIIAGQIGSAWVYERLIPRQLDLLSLEILKLECSRKPTVVPPTPPFPPISPIHDPSGYVYEAVESNRLEGVKATAYYKESVEDMYGDIHENVVLWDAEEYAQENPLFTDANGMYQWDVPQGLWQVKFEKDGYETNYSEWLPVPPPQMDVNIEMTQLVQPRVEKAVAYENAIDLTFDKYMDVSTITTDRILAQQNAQRTPGQIVLKDAVEQGGRTLVKNVRYELDGDNTFLGNTPVTLTVSRAVQSYAGKQMLDDYTQDFDIKKEAKDIVVDSLINVVYGDSVKIVVGVLPADAAMGKTIKAISSSEMISSVTAEAEINAEGVAELWVSGELPGTAQLTFELDDTDLVGEAQVNVVSELVVPYAPIANRISGTAVYRGTVITLSSRTDNSVIYYTTDGTCPCDAGAQIYDGSPITIDGAVTIKAMAVNRRTGVESEVAEFNYTLRRSEINNALAEGWNWTSHNADEPINAREAFAGAQRVQTQTRELVNDSQLGMVGNLTTIEPTENVKVLSDARTFSVDGYAIDPSKADIMLYTGWNWIGYPVDQTQTLDEAFAKFNASEGDVLQGQDGFATYVDGQWTGALATLQPGQGYMYKSMTNAILNFADNKVSNAQSLNAPGIKAKSAWPTVDVHKYPNQMSIIADLREADVNDYQIAAFDENGECRGVSTVVDGRLFISVYGTSREEIHFLAAVNDSDDVAEIKETCTFAADAYGTINDPYMLTLGSITGIDDIIGDAMMGNGEMYDVMGRKVVNPTTGVYIVNGKKVFITK